MLLDVGGGTGIFSIMAVKAQTHLKSVVFDVPAVCAVACERIRFYKVAKKVKTMEGNILTDDLPSGADVALISTVLDGYDEPEDYTRIFFESYNDSNIGWRLDAQKILVNFGDSIPHDCNLNEGIIKAIEWSTGGDPGPDEIMGNSDDLDLQDVLAEMKNNNITLIECHSSTDYLNYWENWTGITGGCVNYTNSTNFLEVVEDAITYKLEIPKIYDLTLKVTTPGFEQWLNSVYPNSYPEVNAGSSVTFQETICVPIKTLPGVYKFNVSAVDGEGNVYGTQVNEISLNVPPDAPINPKPTDGKTDVTINPKLSVYVFDSNNDKLNVQFYDKYNTLIGTDSNVSSGTNASITWSGLDYSTIYYWYAIADDSEFTNKSATWSFTTKNAPIPPPPPPPKNRLPIADASAGGPYYGFIDEDIDFDGSRSYDLDGSIVEWYWDFDDGTDAYGEIVTHNYSSEGTYKVTLTVTDNEGAKDDDKFNVVIVTANNPPKDLVVDGPSTGKQNIEYEYTASATDVDEDDMLRFTFDWGDGTKTTSDFVDSGVSVKVKHKWSTYGVYEVKVTARDNFSAEISKTITVLIDVIVIDEEEVQGLIIDEDGTNPFDIFNNTETHHKTAVKLDSGSYLIDTNGDDKWDYAFNFNTGLITYYEFVYNKYIVIYEAQKATPGFELIFVLLAIAIMVVVLKRKRR